MIRCLPTTQCSCRLLRSLPFVIWLTSTINGCFTHSKVWRRHPNYASILVRLSSLGVKVRVFLVQLVSSSSTVRFNSVAVCSASEQAVCVARSARSGARGGVWTLNCAYQCMPSFILLVQSNESFLRTHSLGLHFPASSPLRLQASELVAKGQKKYDSGDRMGALKLWEQALSRVCTQQSQLASL